jgi:uncharacterized RmlC-like cupin family protein
MPGKDSDELGRLLNVTPWHVPPNMFLLEGIRGSEELERIAREIHRIEQVTVHLFAPGKIGGNHLHRHKREILIASGDLTVYLHDPVKNVSYSEVIPAGHRFEMVPWVGHASYNAGNEPLVAVEFANMSFNPADPRRDVYMLDRCLVTGNRIERK